MDRKGAWIIAGGLLVGGLIFGLSHLWAQRFGPPPGPGMGGGVGRYQVVSTSAKTIIVIDTATGDLYRATPKDVKSISSRPKAMPRGFGDDNDNDDNRPPAKKKKKGDDEDDDAEKPPLKKGKPKKGDDNE
jgi:hypothetical protein